MVQNGNVTEKSLIGKKTKILLYLLIYMYVISYFSYENNKKNVKISKNGRIF